MGGAHVRISCILAFWKDPDDGKDRGQEEKETMIIRWLDKFPNSMDRSLSKPWEVAKDREAWCCSAWGRKESDTAEAEWQQQQVGGVYI